jgi:HPt (histidine-containing phosphotransfer) domain-containing protein
VVCGSSPAATHDKTETDMTPSDEPAPDFDASMLADLESSLPRPEFQSFIKDYLESAVERLRCAEGHVATGDIAALATEAHILISTAGSYGFRRASILARQLETACKAGDAARATALMSELGESSRRAWAAMRQRFVTTTD